MSGISVQWVALATLFAIIAAPVAATKRGPTCDGDDTCIDRLIAHPPLLTKERLPPGYRIGRCLFQIDGRTLIRGHCAYHMAKDGGFHITGPRQVFDGIDYPKAGGMAAMISTDWWADVFRDDGGWTGYSNADDHNVGSVHGQASRWGKLTQRGACFSSHKGGEVMQQVRVCLWKS